MKLYIIPILCIILFSLNLKDREIIKHELSILHRGEEKRIAVTLNEFRENDVAIDYFMDVESVVCLKNLCKVVPVQLHWNLLGEYDHFELRDEDYLEKYEGDKFERQDYQKLDYILSNKESPFKDTYMEEVLTIEYALDDELDALSGATALVLDEQESIDGAVLTCYTLWHWANGEVSGFIYDLTSKNVSNERLHTFLKQNINYKKMAFEQLASRGMESDSTVSMLCNYMPSWTVPEVKLGLNYLKNVQISHIEERLLKLFEESSMEKRILYLELILSDSSKGKESFLRNMSLLSQKVKSFQEVNMLVDSLEHTKTHSEAINNYLIRFLEDDQFIIGRRVYWYLSNEDLTSSQKSKFHLFKEKNIDRL